MYHDSDDEIVSGDDEGHGRSTLEKRIRRTRKKLSPRDEGQDGASKRSPWTEGDRKSNTFTKHIINRVKGLDVVGKKNAGSRVYSGFRVHPVIVVDYDLTLVNCSSKPFPGSHEFIEKLRDINDGQNQLILYSHGSPAYIDEGLNKHYERERKYFDEIVSDSSARNNKPVTYVRRVIKRLDHLIGPYVIIDDKRSNLDSDQYDIVIDVTRMTKYDDKGTALSVDYHACLCTLDRGIRAFLNTKSKSPS